MKNYAPKSRIAPPLLAGVLLLLFVVIRVGLDEGGDVERSLAVQQALNEIPRQFQSPAGTWIYRRTVPVPSGQAELLGLTFHASLEYQRVGTFPPVTATIFIAYCDDVRSMAGHHPPTCYPASGWEMSPSEGGRFQFSHPSERVVKGQLYKFSRKTADKTDLWIMNGFFDGKGNFVDRLEDAESLAEGSLFSSQAMFQFQFLFQGDFRDVDIQGYAEEILGGIPGSVLVGGVDGGRRKKT